MDFSFRLRPNVSTIIMLRTYQAFETHYVHQTILSSNLYKHYLEVLQVKQENVLEGTKNKHRRKQSYKNLEPCEVYLVNLMFLK